MHIYQLLFVLFLFLGLTMPLVVIVNKGKEWRASSILLFLSWHVVICLKYLPILTYNRLILCPTINC